MKNFFIDSNQINKCPKTVSCKECTYVQKHINENDEKIDTPADSEQTFLSSYFMKEPIHTVESIEVRLMKSIWRGYKIKEKTCVLKNKMTITSPSVRKNWQHAQMTLLLMIWRKVPVKQKMTRMKKL